jgi:hypothetical protein
MTFDPPETSGARSAYAGSLGDGKPSRWQALWEQLQMEGKAREEEVQVHHPKIGEDTFKNPPKVVQSKSKSYEGRIANYRTSTVFELPEEVSRRLGKWPSMRIKQIGPDVWEFSQAHNGFGIKPRLISGLKQGLLGATVGRPKSDEGKFGMSPAEYVWVDNQLLASVKEKLPTQEKYGRKWVREEEKVAAAARAAAARKVGQEALVEAMRPHEVVGQIPPRPPGLTWGKQSVEVRTAGLTVEPYTHEVTRQHPWADPLAVAAIQAAAETAAQAPKAPPPEAPPASPAATPPAPPPLEGAQIPKAMTSEAILAPENIKWLLVQLRYIERYSPYRLGKLKDGGDWAFIAPTIK